MNKFGETIETEKKQTQTENDESPTNLERTATRDPIGSVSAEESVEAKAVIELEEKEGKQKDEARINQIMEELGIEKKDNDAMVQEELQEYYSLDKENVEQIAIIKAKDLPANYQKQLEAFQDERLESVNICVVPDEIWKKSQPSESSAEKNMILINQSYFERQDKPDEISWMLHELAHCQNFMDSQSEQQYKENMQTFAFEDLKTQYPYPNNLVEKQTFTKQFEFLKKQGKSRSDILSLIGEYYDEEDVPFFNRLLDDVYGV